MLPRDCTQPGAGNPEFVNWLRTQVKARVFTHLPFGHVATKVLLPVGAQASLSVEGQDALLYWGHQ